MFEIKTTAIDLQYAPFEDDKALWQHPVNYEATQQLARIVREADIGGILYRSVRDPQPSWCLALLAPAGFAKSKPHHQSQIWYLAVAMNEIIWRRDTESIRFATVAWRMSC